MYFYVLSVLYKFEDNETLSITQNATVEVIKTIGYFACKKNHLYSFSELSIEIVISNFVVKLIVIHFFGRGSVNGKYVFWKLQNKTAEKC